MDVKVHQWSLMLHSLRVAMAYNPRFGMQFQVSIGVSDLWCHSRGLMFNLIRL